MHQGLLYGKNSFVAEVTFKDTSLFYVVLLSWSVK